MLEGKICSRNTIRDRLNEKITFPDGLHREGAFWNGGIFGKEKARDSYTYVVKTGVFGFDHALRYLKVGRDQLVP